MVAMVKVDAEEAPSSGLSTAPKHAAVLRRTPLLQVRGEQQQHHHHHDSQQHRVLASSPLTSIM
jgi:hypothetical protein